MGSVAMGTGGTWIFEGYLVSETAYCLYCDKCGSFQVMCLIPIPKWMGAVIFLAILMVGLKNALDPAAVLCGSAIVLIILTADSIRHLVHICKKCGNSHITHANVLDYPEFDQSVLDVPYKATIKYYRDE